MAKKNARNTRGKIVEAAWQLFYEQGYEDTTVEEIIESSHTSKGSFYHYFDGKDALLSTLSDLFDQKYLALQEAMDPAMPGPGPCGRECPGAPHSRDSAPRPLFPGGPPPEGTARCAGSHREESR